MNAGELRTRARLQQRTHTSDGQGGEATPHYADVSTYWVDVAPLGGREEFAAFAQSPDVSHVVTMRHRRAVDASMRFLIAPNRALDIVSVLDANERHEWLTIGCREYKP